MFRKKGHNIFEIEIYKTERGNAPFQKYISSYSAKDKEDDLARMRIFINRLKECGFSVNQKYPSTIKHLRGEIYELRPYGHRILFFKLTGAQFVILHAFEKKRGTTPPREIDKAEDEMKDYNRRQKNGG